MRYRLCEEIPDFLEKSGICVTQSYYLAYRISDFEAIVGEIDFFQELHNFE
jgi:hypothetical protein